MKRLFFLGMIINTLFSFGQTYKARETIRIKKYDIWRKVTIPSCKNETAPVGSIVHTKKVFINDQTEYSIETSDTIETATLFPKNVEYEKNMGEWKGKASVYVDEKDKSILHINYFKVDTVIILSGMRIDTIERTFACTEGTPRSVADKTGGRVLTSNETYNMLKYTPAEYTVIIDQAWYANIPKIIRVSSGDTTLYYLIDKYNEETDYYIKFENRDYISLVKTSMDLGPVTVPFKIRPGVTNKNSKDIPAEYSAEFNLGVYWGFSVGRERMRYEKSEVKKLSTINFSLGGFFALSKIDVDASSTSSADEPLVGDAKKSFIAFTPGLALMGTLYNFQLGMFFGLDVGFGGNAKKWNYNNRPWIGFGVGYDLTSFWKK